MVDITDAGIPDEEDEEIPLPKIRSYKEFWAELINEKYQDQMSELQLMFPKKYHIEIDYVDVEEKDPQVAEDLRESPSIVLRDLRQYLMDYFQEVLKKKFYTQAILKNVPGEGLRIKDLRAHLLNKLVVIEGVVKRVTEIKPMEYYSVYVCPKCGAKFGVVNEPFSRVKQKMPCPNCRANAVRDPSLAIMCDAQIIEVQENLEELRGGEFPHTIPIFVEGVLAGIVFPGDRVRITGIFKRREGKGIVFETYIHGFNIERLEKEFEELEITPEDEKKIKELASREDITNLVVKSIAPSIHGMEVIKEAIALQLFGGVSKFAKDGTYRRGDIHILLVGDPGKAKSQLLQYIAKLAPRAVYTSGKGSTAAGLCVSYDSKIEIDGREIPIGEFVENQMKDPVKTDEGEFSEISREMYVKSLKGFDKAGAKVLKVWKLNPPGKLIEVFADPFSIKLTPETPLLTLSQEGLMWKRAKELKEGDLIATAGGENKVNKFSLKMYCQVCEYFEKEKKNILSEEDLQREIKKIIEEKVDVKEIIKHLAIGESLGIKNLAQLVFVLNSDLGWTEVKEVREIEWKEPVYDLTVEGSHAFFANGVLVHNTAAAVRDEMGRWSLEAGALVLADKGIACIDEFDKMRKEDRAAMHQAMEQQEVSIAKAGITATLKTRAAILAAANPKYGRFIREGNMTIVDQIDLPPTLFSRFDLIFAIFDESTEEEDKELAEHILKVHAGEDETPAISPELLRKYIAYAKKNVKPKLSKKAREVMKDFFVNLRNKGRDSGVLTITARQLESLIRLSEASARMRLSEIVDEEDARRAITIMMESLKLISDKETGLPDVLITTAGISSRETSKYTACISEIKEIISKKGEISEEEIIHIAEKYGVSPPEKMLHNLKSRGEIYEYRSGYYRWTGSRASTLKYTRSEEKSS